MEIWRGFNEARRQSRPSLGGIGFSPPLAEKKGIACEQVIRTGTVASAEVVILILFFVSVMCFSGGGEKSVEQSFNHPENRFYSSFANSRRETSAPWKKGFAHSGIDFAAFLLSDFRVS